MNGKSANLNNCLKNVIFPGVVDRSTAKSKIHPQELLVVFDADMVAKKNFFCKVTGLRGWVQIGGSGGVGFRFWETGSGKRSRSSGARV
jgi:hypothetical protein